jgi:predicted Rossmann fold flavoprotein
MPVSDIEDDCLQITEVVTDKGRYRSDVAVVATGGMSYPSTGSTGDGYGFAQKYGHTIVDLKCGLCGLNTQNGEYTQLQGLALKNVALTAKYNGKTVFSDFGELLFTHFGISGPIALSLSSKINRLPLQSVNVELDLKPALDEPTLDRRLLRDFDKYKNKQIVNALIELLPQKMIAPVLKKSGIDEKKNVNILTKEERLRLLKTIKRLPIKIDSLRGFSEAIITSGGIELTQINPKTMESKLVQGLKFCGEVLDVDAFTGGFNMQIAFATGYVAGNTI